MGQGFTPSQLVNTVKGPVISPLQAHKTWHVAGKKEVAKAASKKAPKGTAVLGVAKDGGTKLKK